MKREVHGKTGSLQGGALNTFAKKQFQLCRKAHPTERGRPGI